MVASISNKPHFDDIARQLSFGVGLVDCSTFEVIETNNTLGSWLNVDSLPMPIVHFVPEIRMNRLRNVAEKNRVYRTKISVTENGSGKDADIVFRKISIHNQKLFILAEVTLDDAKQEVDALISTYQETMENYKTQLLHQKEQTVEAINAKADLLSNMNEQLEREVKNRTMELEHAKSRLSHQANHDALTGLPNRRLYKDRLEHAVELSLRDGNPLAVFYLDLDKFKQINDRLGHNTGDELLKVVADRLRQQVSPADTVARMGGDEFCIIAEDTNRNVADTIADNIVTNVTQPIFVAGYELLVSISVGICMLDEVVGTATAVTHGADAAMYSVKSTGKNGYLFFDAKMESSTCARVEMENNLQHAIANKELFLVYQPILDLNTMEISKCEALLRWHHPVKGVVSPGEFIPIAEESGLIKEIGQWVLETAIDQIQSWQNNGIQIPSISVNISGRQLEDTKAMYQLLDTIKSKSVDPASIGFELTESVLMGHTSVEGIDYLKQLKSNGHQIAIDDFGTGYSSLSYLSYLPVTTLKIDRSFISELSNGEVHKTIVTAVLAIAKNMNLKVTAEGIETREQRDFLIENNCDEGQGFLFSKPLLPEEIEEYVGEPKVIKLRYG